MSFAPPELNVRGSQEAILAISRVQREVNWYSRPKAVFAMFINLRTAAYTINLASTRRSTGKQAGP